MCVYKYISVLIKKRPSISIWEGMGVWREEKWEGLHVKRERECCNYILIKKLKITDHICLGRYDYYILSHCLLIANKSFEKHMALYDWQIGPRRKIESKKSICPVGQYLNISELISYHLARVSMYMCMCHVCACGMRVFACVCTHISLRAISKPS